MHSTSYASLSTPGVQTRGQEASFATTSALPEEAQWLPITLQTLYYTAAFPLTPLGYVHSPSFSFRDDPRPTDRDPGHSGQLHIVHHPFCPPQQDVSRIPHLLIPFPRHPVHDGLPIPDPASPRLSSSLDSPAVLRGQAGYGETRLGPPSRVLRAWKGAVVVNNPKAVKPSRQRILHLKRTKYAKLPSSKRVLLDSSRSTTSIPRTLSSPWSPPKTLSSPASWKALAGPACAMLKGKGTVMG
ncbi:hypothetical protein NMY22_g2555 [Coprinellus aureogranulatus]|nr:hypothetical protein NMY22_g2555 [Coprinellus aureogranulatus]